MQVASAVIYTTAILFSAIILFKRKITPEKITVFILLVIVFGCYLYKLNTFPNIFIDEANGYYDAYSLAKYGVDSHLMSFPVYLQSFAGQGQSVLLAYLSIPFLKLFGFSIFTFRLTLVVVGMIAILLTCYVLNRFYIKLLAPIMLALCTSPYLVSEVRYAMDCNISLWVLLLMLDFLFIGINVKKSVIPFTIFFLLCGLLAYAYNVAWIYLAIFISTISILLYCSKRISLKVIILEFLMLFIVIAPILIFAIRSNIPELNHTIKLGIITIPELPLSRASASFISFQGNIVKSTINNIYHGFQMLFMTSDGLTWNSLPIFGAYYPFAIILFVIGLYQILKKRTFIEARILLVTLISNLPVWLIVLPNYNHWMFTHIPVLIIIGIGIKTLTKVLPYRYLYVLYLIYFMLFINAYFSVSRYTGFDTESIRNVKNIDKYSHNHNVYFESNDKNLLLVVRDFSQISPYEFQKTKDNPYSRSELLFYDNLSRYHRLTEKATLKKGDYLLTTDKKDNHFKMVERNMTIGNTNYYLYCIK